MVTRCRSSRQRYVDPVVDDDDDNVMDLDSEVLEQRHRHYKAWTKGETESLKSAVAVHGTSNWVAVANLIPGRTSKQCRDRWHNFAADGIIPQTWTAEDDMCIARYHAENGPKWSKIARLLPGRTQLAVKNRWHSVNRAKGSSCKTLLHAYVRELQAGSSPKKALLWCMAQFPRSGPAGGAPQRGSHDSTNNQDSTSHEMDTTPEVSTASDPLGLELPELQPAALNLPDITSASWLHHLSSNTQPPPPPPPPPLHLVPYGNSHGPPASCSIDSDSSPQGSAYLSCPGTPVLTASNAPSPASSPTTNTNSPTSSFNTLQQLQALSCPALPPCSTQTVSNPTSFPLQNPHPLLPINFTPGAHALPGSPNLSSSSHHLPNSFSSHGLIHKPNLLMQPSKSDPTVATSRHMTRQGPAASRALKPHSLSMVERTLELPSNNTRAPLDLHTTSSSVLKRRAAFFANLADLHFRAAADLSALEFLAGSGYDLGLAAAAPLPGLHEVGLLPMPMPLGMASMDPSRDPPAEALSLLDPLLSSSFPAGGVSPPITFQAASSWPPFNPAAPMLNLLAACPQSLGPPSLQLNQHGSGLGLAAASGGLTGMRPRQATTRQAINGTADWQHLGQDAPATYPMQIGSHAGPLDTSNMDVSSLASLSPELTASARLVWGSSATYAEAAENLEDL